MKRSFSCQKSVLASIVFSLSLLLFGSQLASAAENSKKLRLAYAGWEVGTAVSYVGIDGGIFKKHEVEVEEVFIRDTLSAGVQSLVGVDLLIGFGNPLAILQPVLAGADIAFLGSHIAVEHYGMGVASEIAGIKDLKGKRVGVSALGGKSDLIARVILRRAGLDPVKDVQIVAAGLSPARALAISKNLIQGAPLSPDVASEAKKLGIKVFDVKGVPVTTALLMTTRSYIRKNDDLLRRFMKGYSEAIHYFLTNRNESLAIIKKYMSGAQSGALEGMYDNFASQLRPLPELNVEAIQALVDTASVVDPRSSSLKPAELFETRFLDELKASDFIRNLYTEKVRL